MRLEWSTVSPTPSPGGLHGDELGGMRTDTHIISELLVSAVKKVHIYDAQVFSHHAPVVIDYDITL